MTQTQQASKGFKTGSKTILIGEDDIDDEEFLKEIFNSVDDSFSLVFINNGKEMLSYLQELEKPLPCLILLDYNMPILNGCEILVELKDDKRYLSIPKVVWSTSASETYKKMCIMAGADNYVTKPTNVKDLTEVVRHMISYCIA